MLSYVDTGLNGCHERVLDPTAPQRVASPGLVGINFPLEDGEVVARRTQQAQDAYLIDHG